MQKLEKVRTIKLNSISPKNVPPIVEYAVKCIKELKESSALENEVSLRAVELIKRITSDDTIYPYVDIVGDGDVNMFWVGGDMHIIVDIQKDGNYFWDIKNVLNEHEYGYGSEVPIELLTEALHKFSSIVTENNPRWKELFNIIF